MLCAVHGVISSHHAFYLAGFRFFHFFFQLLSKTFSIIGRRVASVEKYMNVCPISNTCICRSLEECELMVDVAVHSTITQHSHGMECCIFILLYMFNSLNKFFVFEKC